MRRGAQHFQVVAARQLQVEIDHVGGGGHHRADTPVFQTEHIAEQMAFFGSDGAGALAFIDIGEDVLDPRHGGRRAQGQQAQHQVGGP